MKNSSTVCAGLLVLLTLPVFTLAETPLGYSFVSPKPGATHVQPGTGILLHPTHGPATYPPASSLFVVKGEASGEHHGSVRLGGGGMTIYFKPDRPFSYGEEVDVHFKGDASQGLPGFDYSFTVKNWISPERIEEAYRITNQEEDWGSGNGTAQDSPGFSPVAASDFTIRSDYDLPTDFPPYVFQTSPSAAHGNIFMEFNSVQSPVYFNLVLDDSGRVVYYSRTHERNEWFAPLDDLKLISTYSLDNRVFYVMDTTWTELRQISCVNGYERLTNFHDFTLFPDGRCIVMCNDYIDSTDLRAFGGREDAILMGGLFQVLDKDNNLLFQWRSVEDSTIQLNWANYNVYFNGAKVDFFHLNKVTLDTDGNYLISSRHTDAIYKISADSAKTMWVFGGKGNQFTFADLSLKPFSGQHDVQRLPNGHIIFFDNGSFTTPKYGRAIEFDLDEVDTVASLVWEYDHDKSLMSYAKGGVQRLENGNTLVTWGSRPSGNLHGIEVDSKGNVVCYLQMKEGSPYSDRYDTYRVYRSPLSIRPKVPLMTWDEKAARPRILFAKFGDPDVVGYELSFTEQDSGATADTTVAATSLYLDWLPGGLWDVCSRAVYEDDSTSGYSDTMAVTIVVNSAGETASNGIPGSFVVQAYPNPFNSSVRISVESAGARLLGLNLYNELGRLVKTIPLDVAGSQGRILTLDMKGYASGPYFLRAVRSDGSVVTRRIVLLR